MYYLFEFGCIDSSIKDCYVGYTRDYESFLNMHKESKDCQEKKYIDKYGKENTKLQKQTNISKFVESHGGWDLWEFRTISTSESLEETKALKEILLLNHPEKYTINIYGHPTNKRSK
jgi:hypothetical protein